MGQPPSPKHTLERIDNDGWYKPSNCRWATMIEQQNNRRGNRRIAWMGETLTLMQWARRTGINRRTLAARLNKGWPLDKAFAATDFR